MLNKTWTFAVALALAAAPVSSLLAAGGAGAGGAGAGGAGAGGAGGGGAGGGPGPPTARMRRPGISSPLRRSRSSGQCRWRSL